MRPLVTAFALLLAATASAQTPPADAPKKDDAGGVTVKLGADTVTLYGLIEATIGNETNMDAAGHNQIAFRTSWFSGNRWGILTRHPVSSDLAVISKLESEYTVADGAMDTPNVLFNRDAWVGFDSQLAGQFTFGRQNTLARDFSQTYGDAYGSAGVRMDEGGWTNTNNFKQMIYYAASSGGGTRVDRGINWKKKAGDFVLGAAYTLGNTTNDPSRNTTAAVGLAWNAGPFSVSGFYTHADVNHWDHTSVSVGGSFQIIPLIRLHAGIFHYTAKQPAALYSMRVDNAFTVSTRITPSTDWDVELGYQSMQARDAAQSGSGLTANTLNAFKDASTATAKGTGNRNTFYGSAFYHLSKKAEVYLAGDYLTTTAKYKVSAMNGKTSQTELVAGLRYKF